jgi:hypothetical protein
MKIKNYKEWDYTLPLIGLLFLVAALTSCRAGYGCRGNESWKHMVKRINSGY